MMSRLQSRCLASSLLAHGLLVCLLVLGQGFLGRPNPQIGDGPPLELIPGELIQAALGAPGPRVPNPSTPPAREPARPKDTPPPQPARTVEPPVVVPDRPKPTPKPVAEAPQFDLTKAETGEFVLPAKNKPEKEPPKRSPPEPLKFDFENAKATTKPAPKRPSRAEEAARERAAAEESRKERLRNLANTLDGASGTLTQNRSAGGIKVELSRTGTGVGGTTGGGGAGGGGGGGGGAYAWNVQRIYESAWIPPQNVTDDLATTEVEVSVRKDGKVLRARIVKKAGISALDRSVQEAIDRVSQLPAFESGATDEQRSFTIGFNMHGRHSF